jgi:predicted RecA/RadA family phage recombinase
MAANYIGPGNSINVVAGGTITSGQLVEINDLCGVALTDAVSGETYALGIQGEYEVAKDSSTIAIGDRLWLAAGEATTTAGTDPPLGVATSAAATGAATVRVLLTPATAAAGA